MVSVAVAVLAAAWGAVLPGLVCRYAVPWPDGEPQPPWRRTCPTCSAPLAPWWWPGQRCGACGQRLATSWWLTVPLSVAVGLLVYGAFGSRPDLPAFLVLGGLGVLLALVDIAVLRLPDPLVLAAFVAAAGLLPVAAVVEGRPGRLLTAALGGLACGVGYFVLALVPGARLGYGDVKLGAVLGLYLGWLGWFAVVAAALLAPLANLPFVLSLVVRGRAGRRTPVPYGPAMLVGALAAAVLAALR